MKSLVIVAMILCPMATAFAQTEKDPEVAIELKDGTVVEGKLYKYHEGTYVILSDGKIREIPAGEVASIRHKGVPAVAPPPAKEPGDGNSPPVAPPPEPADVTGYTITFAAPESVRAQQWKNVTESLRARALLQGVDAKAVHGEKSSITVTVEGVDRAYIDRLTRILSARGEFSAYIEASMTDLEKAQFPHPNAPPGRKWLTFEKSDGKTENVIVFDKVIVLRRALESVTYDDKTWKETPMLRWQLTSEGVGALQSAVGNDRRFYCVVDGRCIAVLKTPLVQQPFTRINADDGKIIEIIFKYPYPVEITTTVIPVTKGSKK